ncbi:MAG: hypothetical protein ACOCXD_03285 [Bacteroidota bacterium]
MILKLVLLSLVFLSLAMLGLGLNMLIRKNGRFPAHSVGKNPNMKKQGITCVKHDELRCHRKIKPDNECHCG